MKYLILVPFLVAAGCDSPSLLGASSPTGVPGSAPPPVATLNPAPPPPPPPTARTVDQFDTTTAEDRAAAVQVSAPATAANLGTTIATLGPPAEPGIWMKTPLVSALVMGRVEYPTNGKSVNLELRPSGGSAGSGSQISLAAMRLLGIPLTALAEVRVFRN